MYYISCQNCNSKNEVKSEYLTFCQNCGAKLNINFQDWKKNHPKSNFKDFIYKECKNSDFDEIEQPKKKAFSIFGLMSVILGTVLGTAVGIFAISYFSDEDLFSLELKTDENIMDQEWVSRKFQDIKVDLPFELNKESISLPPETQQYIQEMDMYTNENTDGFKVIVTYALYVPELETVSLEGAAEGSAFEMKSQMGVSDFEYDQEYIEQNGIYGIKQKGKYNLFNSSINYTSMIYVDSLYLWMISVHYLESDQAGKSASEKVIKSFEIIKEDIK